jgi:hypothetical protein
VKVFVSFGIETTKIDRVHSFRRVAAKGNLDSDNDDDDVDNNNNETTMIGKKKHHK